MGACCTSPLDMELSTVKTVKDLIEIVEKKQSDLEEELIQVKAAIKDPYVGSLICDLKGMKVEDLPKKYNYLQNIIICNKKVIQILQGNKLIPIKETKERLNNLFKYYYIHYDDNNNYQYELENFFTFIKNYNS